MSGVFAARAMEDQILALLRDHGGLTTIQVASLLGGMDLYPALRFSMAGQVDYRWQLHVDKHVKALQRHGAIVAGGKWPRDRRQNVYTLSAEYREGQRGWEQLLAFAEVTA